MEQIKISVIIPFYDHIDWLKEAVDSVLLQTYKNIEIIVINDGSNEDVASFLDEYGEKIIYEYKSNSGPGATRNRGIEIASGDYICFLDSDDVWLPYKVQMQLEFMLVNGYVWSHTGGEYFASDLKERKTFNFCHNSGWVARRSLISMQVATPSVMIRSDILKKDVNLRFNANMRFSQDSFLYMLLSQYYELGYLNEKCVLIRLRNIIEGNGHINASKRFRIRFIGRVILYNFMNSSENPIIKPLPTYINCFFKQFLLGDKLLRYLERKAWSKKKVEFIAKFLFLYLFLFGRVYIYVNDYIYNLEFKR